MENISNLLFWVSNSLLIPDIILLLLLFVRSILLIGGFYNQYLVKLRTDKWLKNCMQLESLDIEGLKSYSTQIGRSLFNSYLQLVLKVGTDDKKADFLISNFEIEAEKDLSISRLLLKLGPILGLIGTLVAMSPALVGLSQGDVTGMAYNMQIVFATTVIGLLVSGIGLFTLQVKQRWYAYDLNNLDYISRTIIDQEDAKEKK